MMNVNSKIKPTVIAYAITKNGKEILIEARGPKTTFLQRQRAKRNHKKWQADRAHLIQGD